MIQFPIQGNFREIIIIAEMIIVVLTFQFGVIFLNRFFKHKGDKYYMLLAWTILFLCLSVTNFLFILSDFYVSVNDRIFLLNVGYIFIGAGESFVFFNIEREMKSSNYIFTIIILGLLSLLVVNSIFNFIISTPISMGFWGLFLVLLIVYGNKFLTKVRQSWKLNIYGFIIGSALIILGWIGISDLGMSILSVEFRVLGDIFIIIGTTLITSFFIGLPRLSEIDYIEKIRTLFIMHNSGIPIFDYSFKKVLSSEEQTLKPTLYAGGLTTVTQWITDLIQSKEHLEIVDHEDVKIMFEYGKHTINVLIVEEVLDILKNKLKKITIEVENLYQDVLPSWQGDMSPFGLLKTIVQQNFEI